MAPESKTGGAAQHSTAGRTDDLPSSSSIPLEIARALYWFNVHATRFAKADGDLPPLFLPSEALPPIAERVLFAATAGPATTELCTLRDPTWREAETLFVKVLAEHGLDEELTGEQAVRVIELDIAARIATNVDDFPGESEAWRFVDTYWERLDHPTFAILSLPMLMRRDPSARPQLVKSALAFLREHDASIKDRPSRGK